MKKIRVKQYTIDSIYTKMKQQFGTIPKGQEEKYSFEMMVIEEIFLKSYLKNSELKCRQGKEALSICLLKAKGYLEDIEFDFGDKFEIEVMELANKVSKTFIPFENDELKESIKGYIDIDSKIGLKELFAVPIKCINRIYDSIDFWNKERGPHGYFDFINEQFGNVIDVDSDEIRFAIRIKQD